MNRKLRHQILVTNDDGIYAEGINHLVKAMSKLGDVYVCAPADQKSASSHSITVVGPITMEEVEIPHAKTAMKFTGTPADCVKMGLQFLRARNIDIDVVCSGINHGGNLGTDTLYSGTVSAAMEGVLMGVPSLAVSINSHQPAHFEPACRLASLYLPHVMGDLPAGVVLSINLPNLPEDEIRGVLATPLGVRKYVERFEESINESGQKEYRYKGLPFVYDCSEPDNDVIAMQEEFATVTPLHYDLTEYKLLEKVKEWEVTLK